MITVPHLETDVTQACQLSCVACNHLVPVYREERATGRLPLARWRSSAEEVARDLGHLATILHAGAWGALGGEPLLHPGLVDVLCAARESGVADRIEVWTNGLLVERMGDDFWQSLDVLIVSRYEGKLTDQQVKWMQAKCDDEQVRFEVKDERAWRNFRTLLEPVPTDDAATRTKFKGCFFRSFSRVANHGWFFTCCCAPHMPSLLQGKPFGTDGVEIAGITENELSAYLNREEPLGACSICAGRDTAKPVQWHEEKDAGRWIERSAGRVADA